MALLQDVVLGTNIGTGTSKIQLNASTPSGTGTSFITPTLAGTVRQVTPAQVESGAYTAGQSLLTRYSIESLSIGSIQPKKNIIAPTQAFLGVGSSVLVPVLRSIVLNTRLPYAAVPLDNYGTALVANTAAPEIAGTLLFDTNQIPDKEQFYDDGGSTSTGTSTGAVSLSSITVNGGTQLNAIYMHIGSGVVTASNSVMAYLIIQSADLAPVQRIRAYSQPVGAALGTAVALGQPDFKAYPIAEVMRATATITAQVNMDIALTAAGNAAYGIAFQR